VVEATSFGTATPSDEQPMALRILSYNIWNYNPPWDERLVLMIEQIKQNQPAIIGMQEVRFTYPLYSLVSK
jgi:hypothetical protein